MTAREAALQLCLSAVVRRCRSGKLWRVSGVTDMAPQELSAFRARMGWSLAELGRRLEISPSRLADHETGRSAMTSGSRC